MRRHYFRSDLGNPASIPTGLQRGCFINRAPLVSLAQDRRVMFNANFLFASLVWGSVGMGYFIFGKKQSSWPAMVGGLVMMVASYFVGSALLMSLISLAVIAAVYFLIKQGY
jgi:hypothetical protein